MSAHRWFGISALVLLIACLSFVSWSSRAADTSKSAAVASDDKTFESKYIGITMNRPFDKDGGGWLCEVRIQALAGQSFLVGKWYDPESKPSEGTTLWIPLDKVERITVCNTPEEVKKLYDEPDEKK